MTLHEKRVKCFDKHMEKFRKTYKGFPDGEIELSWLKTARDHYAKGLDLFSVVGLYDTSLFGKGKSGYLFTDDRLYWSRSISKGQIWLDEIVDVTYFDETKSKDEDRGVVFHLKDGSRVQWEGFCSVKCGPFIKFVKEYIRIK